MSEPGERPVWSMTGSELLATLDALHAELARLQTRRLQLIARLDDIGHAAEIGANDTAQLLAFRYRLDRPEAHRDARLARALPKYQAVTTALTTNHGHDWVFRPAQADAIVNVLERVPTTVPAEDLEVAEQELVKLARLLSPGELRKAAQKARNVLDTDGPEPEEHKAYRRESLTLARTDNGVKFRGYLANDNAELLRCLIHAGARPHKTIDGEPDPRPRDKRQADALTTALTIAAAASDTGHTHPTTHPTPAATETTPAPLTTTPAATAGTPQTSIATSPTAPPTAPPAAPPTAVNTVGGRGAADLSIFTTDTGAPNPPPAVPASHAAGQGGCARRGVWVPGYGAKANITVTIDLHDLKSAAADATGELVYGDDLSAATIRRLACDAKIIPLVLGSNSEPLDVGRAQRLVTRAMRRALNTRDKGCVICAAPPIHCDAHHLKSWITGGPTTIQNLVLLCRRHHIDLHAGHWHITITNGTVQVSRPTWADQRAQMPKPPVNIRPQPQPLPPSRRPTTSPNSTANDPPCPPPIPHTPNTPATPRTSGTSGKPDAPSTSGISGASGISGTSGTADQLPPFDPWNDTPNHHAQPAHRQAAPVTGQPVRPPTHPRRWPNTTTLDEATRLAIWGATATTKPEDTPPSHPKPTQHNQHVEPRETATQQTTDQLQSGR